MIILGTKPHIRLGFGDKEWSDPEVVKAVAKLTPKLPHLRPLLVAFFRSFGNMGAVYSRVC